MEVEEDKVGALKGRIVAHWTINQLLDPLTHLILICLFLFHFSEMLPKLPKEY